MAQEDDVWYGYAESVAVNATTDLRPADGEEVSLQYIEHANPVELYIVTIKTGGGEVVVGPEAMTVNGYQGHGNPLCYKRFARVKNVHTSVQPISWGGRYTKVPTT